MTLPLLHYSVKPLGPIFSVPQKQPGAKPFGLWFSVGDGEDSWREWCESEGFRLHTLAHCSEIVLSPNAQVLRIDSTEALLEFSKQYIVPEYVGRFLSNYSLNWPAVATKHSGIIIAPYLWECRLNEDCFWYYSWDVASGCIWDASAIAEMHPWSQHRPTEPVGMESHSPDHNPMVDPP